MMGWQDDQVIGGAVPAWQRDAPINPAQPPQPPAAASAPISPSSASPPASSASQPADLGHTAIWNKPSDVGWGPFMLAHLGAGLGPGLDLSAKQNLGEAAALGSGVTMGASNMIPGAKEAAQGLDPQQRTILEGAGYMLGPGKLGIAAKIGGKLAPAIGNWAGGVLGSAGEGAIASGAGTAFQGGNVDDIARAAGIGALTGGAAGTLGGVVGRGGTLPPSVSPQDLKTQYQAAYAPLDAMVFHGPTQVKPALDAVTQTMTGAEQDLAKATMAKVDKLSDQGLVTGSDIQSYQKIFGRLANSSGDADREFAPKFQTALENVMQGTPYARNLTPGQGWNLMPAGTLGGTGFGPGAAAAARDAGDIQFGRAQDLGRLNDWIAKAAVPGGPDVGSQASSYLRSDAGNAFAKPNTPQYDALSTLAGTANPQVSGAPTAWDIRHFAHPLVGAGLGAAVGGYEEGHFDPAHLAEEAAAGALLGYVLHKGVPAVQSRFFQGPQQQRAIDAARVALSTGQPQAPVLPIAHVRDALRSAIFGRGAAGSF
jgi:hypothetical protein